MTLSDTEFERLAVLYAMGALEPDEAARFEAERARRGAEGVRLERGVREAMERAGGGPRGVGGTEREALAAVTAPPDRPRPWGWMAAALLFALLGATAVLWGLGQRSRAGREADAARLEARRADSLRSALAEATAAQAGYPPADELVPLLAGPGIVPVPLDGAGDARATLFATGTQGALLVARGLAPLNGGTYQLWRRTAEEIEPVAALGDAPRGFLFALFTDVGFLEGAQSLLVTAERGPRAAQPSEPPILEGTLAR